MPIANPSIGRTRQPDGHTHTTGAHSTDAHSTAPPVASALPNRIAQYHQQDTVKARRIKGEAHRNLMSAQESPLPPAAATYFLRGSRSGGAFFLFCRRTTPRLETSSGRKPPAPIPSLAAKASTPLSPPA